MSARMFRQCGCSIVETDDGGLPVYDAARRVRRRQLGALCPRLAEDDHGRWAYQVDLPRTSDEVRRPRLHRRGLLSEDDAQERMERVRQLLRIPDRDDRRGLAEVVALIQVSTRHGGLPPGPAEVAARYRLGLPLAPAPTVGAWLDHWLAGRRGLAPNTLIGYRAHARLYLHRYLGHLRLDRLRAVDVEDMLEQIEEHNELIRQVRAFFADPQERARARVDDPALWVRMRHLHQDLRHARVIGVTSQRQVISLLRQALDSAVGQRFLLVNPAAYVELPTTGRPQAMLWTAEWVRQWQTTGETPGPVMVWTPEQTGAFLDTAASDPWYPLFHLLVYTGMRRGEGCGLRWADIDLTGRRLWVRQQVISVAGQLHVTVPKTPAGRRQVALDAGTVRVLAQHRAATTTAQCDSGLAFAPDGEPLVPDLVTKRFHALVEQAGLPPLRLHGLRHGAATLLLAAGTDMKVVQERLGHTRYATTADLYTTVLPSLDRHAAEAAAALVPRRAA